MNSLSTNDPLVLVLGGARSGKSAYAERMAAKSGATVTYVATAAASRNGHFPTSQDTEFTARIAHHRASRPAHWTTIEEPMDLAGVLSAVHGTALVDCLTLWLTNLMLAEHDIKAALNELVETLEAPAGPRILVSNEVGEGIVPATALGRAFRDEQGMLNRRMAEVASHVVKVIAGQPLLVKPAPEPEIFL